MTSYMIPPARGAYRRLTRIAGAVLVLITMAGCKGIFDVDNPNNVGEEALDNPAIATSLQNGVQASTERALAAIYAPYSTLTDELDWVGSRDAYKQLDDGTPTEVANEFVDAANFYLNEARWMSDQAIKRLTEFETAGTLGDPTTLARTLAFGAVVYTTIADMFDDFTFSDRQVPAAPVGEANMSIVYDSAITFLDRAAPIAVASGDDELQAIVLALRARAKFSKALWAKLNPPGTVPAAPLVNDAGAVADANAALAAMAAAGEPDFKFDIAPTTLNLGFPILGNDLNLRLEMRFGDVLIVPDPAKDNKTTKSVKITDVVNTSLIDPVASATITAANAAGNLVVMTQASAREMHLILAEAALAAGSTPQFITHINNLRALNPSLSPYNGTGPTPLQVLIHSRQVNLLLQGRRLSDLYRFNIKPAEWETNSKAYTTPGCFFPITTSERQANTLITTQPVCGQ
jgi:starch-binding outer membrane protein, SusD/RagB family